MIRQTARSAFALLLLSPLVQPAAALAAPTQDLAPPDVTFYLGAQATRTDLEPFDQDTDDGLRLRFGAQFNDARWGDWVWSFEGSLTRLVDSTATSQRTEQPSPLDPPELERRVYTTSDTIRINGFELGGRLYDGKLFFARTGVYVYSLKTSRDVVLTEQFNDGSPDRSTEQLPESESISRLGPYIGAGINLEVATRIYLNVQYDGMVLDGEYVDTGAAGLELRF